VPSTPFVVPPLLLIVLLLLSALAKVRHPSETRSVFRQLQLPDRFIELRLPLLLPYAELVLAAGLLLLPGGWYIVPATLAVPVFGAYVVVIWRALRFPYDVKCGCFGRLGLGEVTTLTLARNLVLLGVALITFADSWRRDGVLQRLRVLGDGWWWLAGVALAVVVTFLVAYGGKPEVYLPNAGVRIPAKTERGYVAYPTPYVVFDGPDGLVSAWQLTDVAARMLVFAEPDDRGAERLLGQVRDWAERLRPVQLHVVGGRQWPLLATTHPELADLLLGDPDRAVQARFEIETRGAVLLGMDRFLAGGPANGDRDVERLVEAAIEELRESGVHPDGSVTPQDDTADIGAAAIGEAEIGEAEIDPAQPATPAPQ
jgi:hypothetical protein